eukprot:6214671-Pleurochrysis_carterae.AAC.3
MRRSSGHTSARGAKAARQVNPSRSVDDASTGLLPEKDLPRSCTKRRSPSHKHGIRSDEKNSTQRDKKPLRTLRSVEASNGVAAGFLSAHV